MWYIIILKDLFGPLSIYYSYLQKSKNSTKQKKKNLLEQTKTTIIITLFAPLYTYLLINNSLGGFPVPGKPLNIGISNCYSLLHLWWDGYLKKMQS